MKEWNRSFWLLLTLACLVCPHLRAATQNVLVKGSVYGPSYEPIEDAAVFLFSPFIGFSQTQVTNSRGWFAFQNVPPADYTVLVTKRGFADYGPQKVHIDVGLDTVVLPPITLGLPQRPLCQQACPDTVNTTMYGVIHGQTILTVPLVNRDFIDLTLLAPGTYPVEQGSNLEGASLVVNGARANMNNFLLDGADNNDYTINQSLPFQIVETLQEFRVQTSTSPAEFGRSAGAQINEASRSGTNALHGTVFEYFRNSALSANDFFSAYNGGTFGEYVRFLRVANFFDPVDFPVSNALADPTVSEYYERHHPLLIQNEFGANVGGPLIKNKLFGFFNYEGFRVSDPRPLLERVPGLNLRQASQSSVPLTAKLFNLYPLPNVPTTVINGTPITDPTTFAFFVGESANWTASDNFLGRIDWELGHGSRMSFKENVQNIGQVQGGAVPQTSAYPGSGTRVRGRNQNFSFNYVQTVNPHTSNEFRFGWNRFRLATSALDNSIDPSALGFQNLNFQNQGIPNVLVGGQIAAGDLGPFATLGASAGVPDARADYVWSLADNLSLHRGKHNSKFGIEFRHVGLNTLDDSFGRGVVTFFSGDYAVSSDQTDVASIARVSPQFGGGFDRYFRTQSLDWYAQDQWQPRADVTLNYGVRYEVNTAPIELRNRLVNYYPALGGLVQGGSTLIYDPSNLGHVLGLAPTPVPRAGFKTDTDDYGPHIGWAWNPRNNGKTVVRGGYALVYDQQSLQPSVNMLLNPPFVHQDFSYFPNFAQQNTFSQNSASSVWFHLPYSVTAIDPDNKTPYLQQFNFGIEQQVANGALVGVAYVGSVGRRLPMLVDLVDCSPSSASGLSNACFNPALYPSNPFAQATILNQQNSANSSFNSLQAQFETRSFHGLNLDLHYQWAKSMDDASSLQPQVFLVPPAAASLLVSKAAINPENFAAINNISPTLSLQPTLPIVTTRPRLPQNSSEFAAERARSDFDITHRFVASYIYNLPQWKRDRILASGWQVAGITTIQTGQPFSVFDDFFGIPLRPDQLQTPALNFSNPQASIDGANIVGQSPSSFGWPNNQPNAMLQPGNLGRNSFTGPGLIEFDFSVLKNISVGEGKNVQLRAEFFNLFNHTNFYQPIGQAGLVFANPFGTGTTNLLPNPFFGQIIQARPPREIQFAITFTF